MEKLLTGTLGRRELLAGSIATAALTILPARAMAAPTDARLLDVARQQLARMDNYIWVRDVVGLADFSMPSSEPRFFIVNMESGDVRRYYVTHGRGSDPEHDGWLKAFSNDYGSNATSRGAYLTRNYYEGKHGLSMRLTGLEPDNNNAETRAIVVHGADYANPDLIRTMGKLGRSEGCFAFPRDNLVEVIARMGPGRMIFADRLEAPNAA
ncbi:MAG: twin-arginine translocation pathway signal [Sphingomonadaceae bacterium]|nr:twin-arginine translocation pathway signal [Sphingomonadaceae bacterium]NBU78996.1 twin-arginine translocation pathway signal [Sphingomonadaceae bacterium]